MWKTVDVSERVDVMFSRVRREEIERNNDVRQSRGMLRTLSEAVLYLSRQELPFRGHDESSNSLNQGNHRELLDSFAKFDTVFARRLYGKVGESERGNTGVFTGFSGDTQNDLIECIDSVIQDQIDEEVQQCTFLNVQVDESTDVSTKEQLSVIIRLDKKDDAVLNKVIMQTCDGASVMSGHISGVQSLVRTIIPLLTSFTVQLTAYI